MSATKKVDKEKLLNEPQKKSSPLNTMCLIQLEVQKVPHQDFLKLRSYDRMNYLACASLKLCS